MYENELVYAPLRMAVSWDYDFETWYVNYNEYLGW